MKKILSLSLAYSCASLALSCTRTAVRSLSNEAPGEILGDSSATPCQSSLASCPANGCAAQPSDDASFNQMKRGLSTATDPSTAVPVTIDALTRLQSVVDAQLHVARRDFTAATRAQLRNLTLNGQQLGEGTLVRLTGFIVRADNDPQHHRGAHPNTGESVNCNLHAPDDNDFHIPIVANSGDKDCQSVTAEMIPQGRPAQWNLGLLHDQIAIQSKRVMVVGPLFYDNAHAVDSNCDTASSGNPKRVTLFEVHPVQAFFVCPDGTCSDDNMAGWQQIQ